MIIRIIATALAQCMARTQAGWITFAGSRVAGLSVAARLDMVVPCWNLLTWIIRQGWLLRYLGNPGRSRTPGAIHSQKSEPGFPGSSVVLPDAGIVGKSGYAVLRSRQQDRIDHVDHAVRLMHVGDRHHRLVALGIDDPGLAVGLLDGELLALDRLELLAVGQIGGVELASDHMVGEDLGQGRLVLGLDQVVDSAGRQLAERGIGRREHREWTFPFKSGYQARSLHCGDQRGVDRKSTRL